MVSGRMVSGRMVSGRMVSGRMVSGRRVSGRMVSGGRVSGSTQIEHKRHSWINENKKQRIYPYFLFGFKLI